MPPPEFNEFEMSEAGSEVGHSRLETGGTHVETQLNNQGDISQAHQFFQAKGSPALPDLHLQAGPTGAESSLNVGFEHAMAHGPVMGAEQALALAQEPISPLIQLIMKMPGLTGVMNSFFEFLGSLFGGNLLEIFNPLTWAQQAAGALNHLSTISQFGIHLSIFPNSMPMLHFNGHEFLPVAQGGGMQFHSDFLGSHASAADVGAPITNGDLQDAIFERTSNFSISPGNDGSLLSNHDSLLTWGTPDNQIASSAEAVYRPTMGGYYQAPSSPAAQPTTHTAPTHAAAHHPAPHHNAHNNVHHKAVAPHSIKELRARDVAAEPQQIAQADVVEPASGSGGTYTVERGDSLWDIAREKLGDGSRWREIYQLNTELIGQNPNLIHPGASLQMPDGNAIASGDYVVQPGDNLWNIAKDHMGGGQNWGELYRVNEAVIGSNPGLIHPGQHLSLGGADANLTASASPAVPTDPTAAATPDGSFTSAAQAQVSPLSAQPAQINSPDMSYPSQPDVGTTGGALQAISPQMDPGNAAGTPNMPTSVAQSQPGTGGQSMTPGTRVPNNDGNPNQTY